MLDTILFGVQAVFSRNVSFFMVAPFVSIRYTIEQKMLKYIS